LASPKIEQLHRAFRGHHDVGRFQIAVHDALAVCGIESCGDLNRQPNGFLGRMGASNGCALDVLQYQVVRTDVVDLTDVGMIQRSDGAGLLLKTSVVLALQPFDRNNAVQAGVAGLPHLTHAACANGGE